jgi:hypothetical protein
MLNQRTISEVTKYWASHLGSQTLERFAQPFHTVVHGPELADYRGIFALFCGNAATVSVPPELADSVRAILIAPPESPTAFASVFCQKGFVTIGPAYIGYADEVQAPEHPVRSLTGSDMEAVKSLQEGCNTIEWEHGGSNLERCPSFDVFVRGQARDFGRVRGLGQGHRTHYCYYSSCISGPAFWVECRRSCGQVRAFRWPPSAIPHPGIKLSIDACRLLAWLLPLRNFGCGEPQCLTRYAVRYETLASLLNDSGVRSKPHALQLQPRQFRGYRIECYSQALQNQGLWWRSRGSS